MEAFKNVFAFNWPMMPVSLHAMLKFCGHELVTGNYIWNGLKRGRQEFILWQHTVSGTGKLVYEDTEYTLKSGDSMLLHMPHNHIYFIPEDASHWEFYFAGFNGHELIRIAREVERQNSPLFHLDNNSEQVRLLKDTVAMASENTINNAVKASSLAYQMISGFIGRINTGDSSNAACPEPIRRAVELCLNSPGHLNTVEELAEVAKMSRFHFSREFKHAMGLSPYEFVMDHALRRAAHLLQTGSFSVKEVASESGFGSVSVFCRAFKKAYGFSPGSCSGTSSRRQKKQQ